MLLLFTVLLLKIGENSGQWWPEDKEGFQLSIQVHNYLEDANVYVSQVRGGRPIEFCINTGPWKPGMVFPHSRSVTITTTEKNCTEPCWMFEGCGMARYRWLSFTIKSKHAGFANMHHIIHYFTWFWRASLPRVTDRRNCAIYSSAMNTQHDNSRVESEIVTCGDEMVGGKKTVIAKIFITSRSTVGNSIFQPPKQEKTEETQSNTSITITNYRSDWISIEAVIGEEEEYCFNPLDLDHNLVAIMPDQTLTVNISSKCENGKGETLYFLLNDRNGGYEHIWAAGSVTVDHLRQGDDHHRICRITAGQTTINATTADSLWWMGSVGHCKIHNNDVGTPDKLYITVWP